MTGCGQGATERGDVRVQVELKGVNHRFLDIKMKLPGEVGMVEPRLRAEIQERVTRARIDVGVVIALARPGAPRVMINRDLVSEYLRTASELQKEFRLKGAVGLETVLAMPGAVTIQPPVAPENGLPVDLLIGALRQALDAYDAMRSEEGARLAEDVISRLKEIGAAAGRIEVLSHGLPQASARRIRERVAMLLEGSRGLDESRLAQEVALLAGRVDITEELVRLKGYVEQALQTLSLARGAVGKTLDFIMQEMNREANTISSKAEAPTICQEALRIKGEVEKIREQVQNLE